MSDKAKITQEQRERIKRLNESAKKRSAFEVDAAQQARARKKARDASAKAAGSERRSNAVAYRDYRGVDGVVKDAEKGKK